MGSERVVLDISSDEEGTIFDGCGETSPDCWPSLEWVAKILELDDGQWASDDVVAVDDIPRTSPVHKMNSTQSNVEKCVSADDSDDDCKVLDGDPDKPVEVTQVEGNRSDELLIVGEKGQLACRDYPHARHLCVTFPFRTTLHEKFCKLCHCYVCDIPAPCVYWGSGASGDDHCHSSDKEEKWKLKRKALKHPGDEAGSAGRIPGATLSIRQTGLRSPGTRTPAIRTSHNNLLQTISSSSMHSAPRSVPPRTSVSMSGSIPAQTSVSLNVGTASVPLQNSDSRSHSLRRCSATGFRTPNIISQRHNHQSSILHSNQMYNQHLSRSQNFSGTNSSRRKLNDSSPQVLPTHTRGRMAGVGFINRPAKRPRTTLTNPNPVYSRRLQGNSYFPASSADESFKTWQDALLGCDPDLGTNSHQCTLYPQSVVYGQSYTQTAASTGTNLLSSSAQLMNNQNFWEDMFMNTTANASPVNSTLLNVQSINPYAVPESNPVSGEVPLGDVIGSLGQERDQGPRVLNPHSYDEQEVWNI